MLMKPIIIDIPGATVVGRLYDHYDDVELLDQDILEVQLANGLTIDVGWFPEYDREGKFVIKVYKDYLENSMFVPSRVKTPQEVADAVTSLANTLAEKLEVEGKMLIRISLLEDVPFLIIGNQWLNLAACDFDLRPNNGSSVATIYSGAQTVVLTGDDADEFEEFLGRAELGVDDEEFDVEIEPDDEME